MTDMCLAIEFGPEPEIGLSGLSDGEDHAKADGCQCQTEILA